jgi:hypothetical protein
MFNVWGKDYADAAAVEARMAELADANAKWGESDDRVTEYNALAAVLPAEAPKADVYTVERDEYEVPCEHPMCEQLHQRFMVTERLSGLREAAGAYVWSEWTERYHNRKVVQWIVLRNGERADEFDVFDTKREAVAFLTARGLA